MGNPFSIPCDSCIERGLQWLENRASYTHNLKKNLAALKNTMEELKAKWITLSNKVTREENRGLQRLAEIQVWLTRVTTIEKETIDLLTVQDVEVQRLCFCGFCSKSFISSYRYGKRVFLTLKEVEKLKNEVFDVVAEPPSTYEVRERQLQATIVGQETMLDKAWNHLKEDGVGIMGMYGMGGVGKTTLLKQLNNKFSKVRSGFDFVIWVVVSKELHVENIQDVIAERVGLGGEEWKQKQKSQKTDVLYNFLKNKRFVLFLDDIWEKVDLVDIGVPVPTTENKCKVAFTTRSQEICSQMGVQDPMEVKCLPKDVAFDLFQKKVGQRALERDPDIPELARIVAEKCGGLPLALNVIGETMSCKTKKQEWLHAIDVLNSYASEFSGMEDKILRLLKYSYDNLKGEELKSCLLYCALFPEDDRIDNERLIEYWICEGIIDGSESIERAENKGYDIIGSLVRASLLMEDGAIEVYMHDVVREMALWIQKESFIVHAGVGIDEIPKIKNRNVVRRMSLMETKIQHLVGSPECLKLTTLLMQKTHLQNISSEFFQSMPKLAVLDLSANKDLTCLPDEISELVSLQYLNLSYTRVPHLPKGLQELKKLIHLDLEYTRELSSIAGISSLHNLIVLKLGYSCFSWDLKTVEELKTLENLEVLTLSFTRQTPCLERYLSSHRLANCTRRLWMEDIDLVSSGGISLPVTMEKLRYFIIRNCSISEIKMVHNPRNPCFLSLSSVAIILCESLRELTFLMFAPNLILLHVWDCGIEDIIKKEKACEDGESGIVPFPKLTELLLFNLPKLKSIYWRPLPFPCLEHIRVIECPNLKKLPLDSKSAPPGENGLVIGYKETDWIEGVEWEDEATKTRFLASCKMV